MSTDPVDVLQWFLVWLLEPVISARVQARVEVRLRKTLAHPKRKLRYREMH